MKSNRWRVVAIASSAFIIQVVGGITPAHAGPTKPTTQEHYRGTVTPFDPATWGGAKDCAVMDAGNVYCFDTDSEFASFTSPAQPPTSSQVLPATTGTCNGWAKIWDGANYTNRGLAFHNYGMRQQLSDYAPTPFNIRSWFTNGQRGYTAMTDCYGQITDNPGYLILTLHTNAQATSINPVGAFYIQLYNGTG